MRMNFNLKEYKQFEQKVIAASDLDGLSKMLPWFTAVSACL
jgi:hypothetical protein